MTRAVIMAAGTGERWADYAGGPKHFLEIDGEQLLPRLVRQLRDKAEIVVSGPPDPRYKLADAALWVPYANPANHEGDAHLGTVPVWDHEGRTILLFGDCWYSDAAMETILGYGGTDWRYFCRFEPSELTGKPWGEGWAWSFYPGSIPDILAAWQRVIGLVDSGVLWRCNGWEHYRAMCGLPDEQMPIDFHGDYGQATVIDDWTEDFDFPHDLDTYLERRALVAA